eukprot:TRINITY_DN9600_c0_g1_i1.p1 TRINITY_DN9600_c0_g1~~TRINITY_DN9600_c0_g1_i1.p1  ORF type:complete len:490 (+),score=91.98 TRINITY_DN9600_c0_g1_i1:97-1566(+)
MFYAPNYFVGKGPMGRIWLAAHWDKKLTKQIIAEINILISIDQVFNNPELPPLALRLSGHLLVGITRIYSRKVKYLLADCSEALSKIKMAFRQSTQVDLPVEDARASLKVINIRLPETIGDLDLALPELPEINPLDLGEDYFTVRAPARDLTRTEPVEPFSLQPDTEEMLEEDPIYGVGDDDEKQEARAAVGEASSVQDLREQSAAGEDTTSRMDIAPPERSEDEIEPYQALTPPPRGDTPPPQSPYGEAHPETPPPPQVPKPPTQPKRKRALLDEDIVIEKRTFEAWLRNDDEITRELEVAPLTKRAAIRREWEIATVDQLISMPNTVGLPEPITALFKSILRPSEPMEALPPRSPSPSPIFPPVGGEEEPYDDDQRVEQFYEEDPNQVPYIEDKSVEGARAASQADITAEKSISEFINSELQEALEDTCSFFTLATKHIKSRAEEQPSLDPKMEVALLFYQLLDSKNNNILELTQLEPYADIIATRA